MAANKECPARGSCVDELEYRIPEAIGRPDFAANMDEGDIFDSKTSVTEKLRRILKYSNRDRKGGA